MKTVSALAATIAATAIDASAAGVDGTAPAICAVLQTFECTLDSDCIRDSPESINLPRFIRLDFAAKKAVAERVNGDELVAEIMSQRSEDGRLVVQGVQNGNGWSLALTQETGDMSLTVSGDEVGYVIFGACTRL